MRAAGFLAAVMLERNPQPQTNRAAAVDTFLGISVREASELVVEIDEISRDKRFARLRVYTDRKIAQICKRAAASSVVSVRRE